MTVEDKKIVLSVLEIEGADVDVDFDAKKKIIFNL